MLYKLLITGQVQGVGFRPFIYRIAIEHQITGWVKNQSGEVSVLAQGSMQSQQSFQEAILNQHPPLAKPQISRVEEINSDQTFEYFEIKKSAISKHAERHIPADYFTCPDCLQELTNSEERRYRYPFINCTQCGPRYTIIKDLPYDRPNTSMAGFPLCNDCYQEYSNTMDRRFHAQPLACEVCGPQLTFIEEDQVTNGNEESLKATIQALESGKIIAVKGIGGYHLICDAENEQAVQRLRQRKHRPDKPLAIMFYPQPHQILSQLEQYCLPTKQEAVLVSSVQRPIVLMNTNPDVERKLAPSIHPGLNEVAVMLAYSPLHFLILKDFGRPIVATSGNLSGEPVLTENIQVENKLANICDCFLQHNRPILRPADDSVMRVINDIPRFIRIGRGVAPLEYNLPFKLDKVTLAVGGQMKNTIALAWGNRMVMSPHIGELDTRRSIEVFQEVIQNLCALYQIKPEQIVCDQHPDYYSSKYAKDYADKNNLRLIEVQHHQAHANMVYDQYLNTKQKIESTPWLVFSWDGTGLGEDSSIWGAEAFYGSAANWQRVCSIKPFYLQGGNKVAREPWRSACSLVWQMSAEKGYEYSTPDDWKVSKQHIQLSFQAWQKRMNTISCSSMGRLFDAASALIGLGEVSSFEGQGPMFLEGLLKGLISESETSLTSSLPLYQKEGLLLADWSELVAELSDHKVSKQQRALHFHSNIATTLIEQAKQIRKIKGDFKVGLSGGVFQNKFLTELILKGLSKQGFDAYLPEKIPYNDAGLAFGQIIQVMDK